MSEFKRFLKPFLLFSSPVWILLLIYLIFDPFYVLRNHGDYLDASGKSFNRDRISTQTFLNYDDQYKFKSFIFGNSKSSSYRTKEWGKYVNDTMAFHFDASNEFLSGIKDKILFLGKRNSKIDNALVILDTGSFGYPIDTTGTIFIKDPRVSPSIGLWQYHTTFLKSFFKEAFFIRYLDYSIFKTFRPYMKGMLEVRIVNYLKARNDFIFKSYEDELALGAEKYYINHADYFYKRDSLEKTEKPLIKNYQIGFLKQIDSVFKAKGTNYEIILDPNYSQRRFNKKDITILKAIFGTHKVHDFSGKNKYSEPVTNFYEIYHYRPEVGNQILKEVYEK